MLRLALLAVFVLSVTTAPAVAQEPAPPDRIELSNGDALTGTIKSITAGKVTIESTALGTVEVPLAEIVSMSSSGVVALQTESSERIDARIAGLDGDDLRIVVDSQERTLPIADLVERRPPVQWTGSIAIGGNYATGNTERRGGTAAANAVRRTDDTRLTLNFNWVYQDDRVEDPNTGTSDWRLSQRRTYGDGKFDYFVSKRLYAYAQGSLENDIFRDLDLRSTVGAGLGYQIFDEDDLKLSIEGGLSYVDESRRVGDDNSFVAARVAYGFAWNVTPDLSLLSDGQIFPSIEDKDDVYARADTRVRLTVYENLFTQVQWIIDWDNTPPANTERVDHQFFLLAGWSF